MQCLQWLENYALTHHVKLSNGSADDIHAVLAHHVREGATLLELGSGLGHDILRLSSRYRLTASDQCKASITGLRMAFPSLPVLQLNATTIQCLKRFDAIFSNKLMQHLSADELHASLVRQQQVVHPGGIIAHTFWDNCTGNPADEGSCPAKVMASYFEIIEVMNYDAFLERDSLMVIARNSRG